MKILKEKIIWQICFFLLLLLYLATYYFDFYSPRGFPLKPLSNLYDVNDFSFYKNFAMKLPNSLLDFETMRAPLLFSGLIYIIISLFNDVGMVSVLFSILIIGILLCSRIYLICSNSKIEFPFYLLICPYFFYYTVFPSSDMLMAVLLLFVIFICANYLENQEKSYSHCFSILILCSLICLSRPQGFIFLVLPIGLAFYTRKNFSEYFDYKFIILIFLAITMILISALYYKEVWITYVHTSQGYLQQENITGFSASILGKFLSSFGLRESYKTVYTLGVEKSLIYHYMRLILGVIIFGGFLITLYKLFQKDKLSIILLIVYALSLFSAISGVSFERYFLLPNLFFFHVFLRFVENSILRRRIHTP